MQITLIQGILLAIMVFLFAWDARWEAFFVFRPIVVAFFTGAILGDVTLGLKAGAIAELAYLGLLTVGGTVPPNPLIAGLMTTVLAYKNGISVEAALGLSLPFALLMQWTVIACQSLFSGFNVYLDKYSQEGNFKKFSFFIFLPEFILTGLYALIAFLSVYALQDSITLFVNSFPEFIIRGFDIAGGILPGVGLGLLLKVMVKKENVAYLVIGFLLMTFMGFSNVLPVALAGMAVAFISFLADTNKKSEVNTNDGI